MTAEENKQPRKSENERELELYDNLSDRHIQIKILKATERTAKNVAFYFWVSLVASAYWVYVVMNL